MKSFSMQIEGKKIFEMNDYFGLIQDCLGTIKQNISNLTVHTFASPPNAVYTVFFSLFDSVGTSGVDFFNQCLSPLIFTNSVHPFLRF